MRKTTGVFLGTVLACACAHADTYYWLGLKTAQEAGRSGYTGMAYRCNENWLHQETGLRDGWPVEGDTVVFDDAVTNTAWSALGNEFCEYGLGEIVYAIPHHTGAGDIGLLAGGKGVRFTKASIGQVLWQSQLKVFGSGDVILDIPDGNSIDSSLTLKPAPGHEGNFSTLVKRGGGRFWAFTDGGWSSSTRRLTIPAIRLEEGIFAITPARNATDTGMLGGNSIYDNIDFIFAGGSNEVLRIGSAYYNFTREGSGALGYSWYLRNSGLYETPNAVNMPHSIESEGRCRLGFFGTPKLNPIRFTGTLELSAGLEWGPDSNAYVFELAHGVSTSTGDIVVKNGTVRVTDGARLPNIASIEVEGAGAVFEVTATAGLLYPRTALTVANGGKIRIPAGMVMRVKSATCGGQEQARGTMLTGGVSPWIDGEGSLYVIGDVGDVEPQEVVWDATGTANKRCDLVANWCDCTELPDLRTGVTRVKVAASEGFVASEDIWVNGFDLSRVSAFQISSDASAHVYLGAGGITGCTGTYHLMASTQLLDDQTWSFEPTAEVYLDQAIGTLGAASLTLLGSNATYRVSGGIGEKGFLLNVDNYTKVRFPVDVTMDSDIRVFNPVEGAQGPRSDSKFLNPIGNVTFNGRVSADWNTTGWFTVDPSAHVTFNEEVQVDGRPFKYETANYTVARFNKRLLVMNSTLFYLPNSTIELNARGNCLGYANNWVCEKGTIRLLVPYALEDRQVPPGLFVDTRGAKVLSSTMSMGAFGIDGIAVLDLCGNDQSLRYLLGQGGTIKSDTDAMMTLCPKDDWTINVNLGTRKDRTTWTGGVGLHYEAVTENWPHFMYRASSTTGRLEVASGRLVFLKGGGAADPYNVAMEGYSPCDRPDTPSSWQNCSSVTVSGGQLELEHGGVFGDETVVYIEGTAGKIQLEEGVVQRVAALYIDGEQQECGHWGSSQSSAVRKHQNDGLFVGTGVLHVLRGSSGGTMVILR